MRTETKLFALSAGFSLVVAAVYWFLSYEDAGSTLLLFMFFAPAFLAGYLLVRARRVRRPADEPEPANVAEDVGSFPAGSVWPFVMAIGLMVAMLGLVFGIWLGVAGLIVFTAASIGLAAESGR